MKSDDDSFFHCKCGGGCAPESVSGWVDERPFLTDLSLHVSSRHLECEATSFPSSIISDWYPPLHGNGLMLHQIIRSPAVPSCCCRNIEIAFGCFTAQFFNNQGQICRNPYLTQSAKPNFATLKRRQVLRARSLIFSGRYTNELLPTSFQLHEYIWDR